MSIELDVKLIKYVEKFPFLYYKGAMNYNNELLLANTWKKIGRDLKVSRKILYHSFHLFTNSICSLYTLEFVS